jgi:hypothetical protein
VPFMDASTTDSTMHHSCLEPGRRWRGRERLLFAGKYPHWAGAPRLGRSRLLLAAESL